LLNSFVSEVLSVKRKVSTRWRKVSYKCCLSKKALFGYNQSG
jgi:hypothetical protein